MGHYWVQGTAVLIEAENRVAALDAYRAQLGAGDIACSTGEHCDAVRYRRYANPWLHAQMMAQERTTHADHTAGGDSGSAPASGHDGAASDEF